MPKARVGRIAPRSETWADNAHQLQGGPPPIGQGVLPGGGHVLGRLGGKEFRLNRDQHRVRFTAGKFDVSVRA
jgi:hypothetical protein